MKNKIGEKVWQEFLISMSDEFLETIDKVATNEQRSRSELIRQALRTLH